MKTIRLIVVLVVAGMVFSCVAAVVKAPSPSSASSYRPGVSCSMLQTKDGSGYRTTMDCN